MTNLFLNYNANTETLSINTFRNPGYYYEEVCDLVESMVSGVSGSCDLDGALDAVRDGSVWAEMIEAAICEYELGN